MEMTREREIATLREESSRLTNPTVCGIAESRYQHGTPQKVSGKKFVQKHGLTR
jgi:hypothetical protein